MELTGIDGWDFPENYTLGRPLSLPLNYGYLRLSQAAVIQVSTALFHQFANKGGLYSRRNRVTILAEKPARLGESITMQYRQGRIYETQLDRTGQRGAWIALHDSPDLENAAAEKPYFPALPQPGQFLVAHAPTRQEEALPTALFAAELAPPNRFLAAPPLPASWNPGDELLLRGPVGRGFMLPSEGSIRLALAALGENASRLLPLAREALAGGSAVALFTDHPLPVLPAMVEVAPLVDLPAALSWANFLAVDLQFEDLSNLREILPDIPPYAAQVLVHTSMPCGGIGGCDACTVPVRNNRWKQVCSDGPVFDLNELEW